MYGGIALGVFVVLLLNNRAVKKSRANLFLSILLIGLSFSILHILFAGTIFGHFDIRTHNMGDPTFLLIPPALWFYSKALTGNRMGFSFKDGIHFLPFVALICFFLLIRFLPKGHPLAVFPDTHHRLVAIIFWIIAVVQFSCYQFFIRKKWRAHQQLIKQEVSNIENVNISWVTFFMNVFLFINFFFLANLFVAIHLEHIAWMGSAIAVIFSLSIFALGYKGILQKEIFYNVGEQNQLQLLPPLQSNPQNKPDHELITKLNNYMEEKKPYLDAELTLSDLAKQLDISRSQLSRLINEGIGDNFYNYVNKYRVEQVKKFMTDPAMEHFNMLGIALEAGFKSKSTFNLIFKRFTGLTPTEYRKNLSP